MGLDPSLFKVEKPGSSPSNAQSGGGLNADLFKVESGGGSGSAPVQSLSLDPNLFPAEEKKKTIEEKIAGAIGGGVFADINEKNSDLNFVDRALHPEKYPKLTGPDGEQMSHKLAAERDSDGKWWVFPTIIQDKETGELKELALDEAMDYAKSTGERIGFDDGKMAVEYAKNGLINHDLPSMGELMQYGATKNVEEPLIGPERSPDLEDVNPLSRAFYYKPPAVTIDQIGEMPEAQQISRIEGEKFAEIVRKEENAKWNTMTVREKEAYLKEASAGNMGRAESYGNLTSNTIFKLAADIPKWSGVVARQFDKWLPGVDAKPIESYAAYYYGQKVQEMLDEMFPSNQKYANDVGGQLVQGAASMIPYVFAGSAVASFMRPISVAAGVTSVAEAASVPSAVVVGVMGAAQNSVPEFDKLVKMHRDAHSLDERDFMTKYGEEGMSNQSANDLLKTYNKLKADTGNAEDYAWQGFLANSLTGITEGLPLGYGMNNIAKFLGTGWKTKLVSTLETGTMEGFQESVTEYVANMSAIQAYDFQRRWYDNVAQSGGIGMLMGTVTFGIAGGLHQKIMDPSLDPLKKSILLQAIKENEQMQSELPSNPNEIVPPKATEATEKVRKKRAKKVVETVNNPPATPEEKLQVMAEEKALAEEEKATLGNPDAKPVVELKEDPTPVPEPAMADSDAKTKKPAGYFAQLKGEGEEKIHKNRRKDSNFQINKDGTVDIIEGKEQIIIDSQSYNPLYEAQNIPAKGETTLTVVTKPVIDPKTGEVLKRGELYFGDKKPTKKQAVEQQNARKSTDLSVEEMESLPDFMTDRTVTADAMAELDKIDFNDEESILNGYEKIISIISNKPVSRQEIVQALKTKQKLIGNDQYFTKDYIKKYILYSTKDFSVIPSAEESIVDPKTGKTVVKVNGKWYTEMQEGKRESRIEETDKKKIKRLDATFELQQNEMVQQTKKNFQQLVEKGEITFTDEKGKPCASMGGRNNEFTRGKKWSIVKDLKGMPPHSKGGVDLSFTEAGVMFKNNNGVDIHAKHGLLICKSK